MRFQISVAKKDLSEILSMLTQSIKTIRQKLYGDASILREDTMPYDLDFIDLD